MTARALAEILMAFMLFARQSAIGGLKSLKARRTGVLAL
jgi:hypothetical protein